MTGAPITCYFDFISPYAYLAWRELPGLAARLGRPIDARPILFGAVLGALGTRGPAEVPPRRAYVFKHVVRVAHDLGRPLIPPPAHPFNPLPALRAVAALDGDDQRRAIDALFDATWAGGGGVDGAEAVGAVLARLGLDAKAVMARTADPAVKQRVKDNTDAMLAAGGFGVPTLVVDGELFFGLDSFAHLERFARGQDPVDAALLARWQDLPASAKRPGA